MFLSLSDYNLAFSYVRIICQLQPDAGLLSFNSLLMSSTTIFEAAAEGDIAYLQAHTSEISTKNDRGWTPLHFAARYGQLEVVKYLKEQNVPTDAVNSEGKVCKAQN